ncbi:hypothetical protein [Desulfomonile tiedjei]|uniref:Uncharacterized protein n=1 Tax=Desulfomonile tiedjei (strain ATCC 49306 / DSM 6799 / DCB-1) TaxID=706587 RepID=I4CEH6_DESTA|nr:hypothetical protein [Desulfomonile tiedjei]AFM27967.1 hypothetical protein Desti_5379 [Desulfomonile tiedjei DSM 6799]
MKRTALPMTATFVILFLVLEFCSGAASAWSARPDEFPSPENLDYVLTQMFPPESIVPPYRIEVWVASTTGKSREGAKTLIEDCLKENLRGLARTEPVGFVSSENALLRIRVWFTQPEGPEAGECYDTTFAVVVGKIDHAHPLSEIVLDAYSFAGIYERQLYQICEKIILRLDLKVLSVLRSIESATHRR